MVIITLLSWVCFCSYQAYSLPILAYLFKHIIFGSIHICLIFGRTSLLTSQVTINVGRREKILEVTAFGSFWYQYLPSPKFGSRVCQKVYPLFSILLWVKFWVPNTVYCSIHWSVHKFLMNNSMLSVGNKDVLQVLDGLHFTIYIQTWRPQMVSRL